MRWFKAAQISGNTVQIDTDTVGNQCLSIDIAEYSVAQYGRLKYKIGSFSAAAGIGNGDNIYYIVDNPFLNPQIGESVGMPLSDGVSKVYKKIHAIGAYSPIQGRFIADWSIESGDIINIVRNSTTYSMPIYQQKMTWRGGFVVSDASNDGDAIRPESATRTNDAFPVYSSATSRSEKKLSSPGWYRAIRLNYALDNVENLSGRTCAVIDINIISQKHENHTIQFRQRPGWCEFCNETSINQPPNNTVIDKIRYTYDSGGTYESEGHIDIHFSGNSSSDISVFYNAFVRSDLLNATIPSGLEPVADIPVNEQLQNEYTFSRNGFVQNINSYFNAASRFNAATYFNADATFNGLVDIVPRRCSAILSTAGWYRVMTFNAPNENEAKGRYVFSIDVTLMDLRMDVHKITLLSTNESLSFVNETSKTSSTQYFTKIRYNYDSSHGYIDVYYAGNNERTMSCFFDVKCLVSRRSLWVPQPFASVADSPTWETVVTTYNFNANTRSPIKYGKSNGWDYVVYSDKTIEATNVISSSMSYYTTLGGFYGYYQTVNTPFTMADTSYYIGATWRIGNGFGIPAGCLSVQTTQFNAYALGTAHGTSENFELYLFLKGTIA